MLLVGCGGREGGSGSAGSASGSAIDSSGSTAAAGASTGTSAPACPITSAQSTLVWDVACYPQSALPTGACSGGSASCSFCSFAECADVPDQSHSPRTFYSCACDGAQWSCAVVAQDAGICPPYVEAGGGSLTQACNDGTGNTDCCPVDAADGLACNPAPPWTCYTRCSSQGWRSTLSCTSGAWVAGMGLVPCGPPDSGTDVSGSTAVTTPTAACDDYFAAQYARGCGGPALPPDELTRIRARFEKVCQNQYALPGSGITPATLEACASALDKFPCELPAGQPPACTFQGSLPGGAPCNEGFQCESGQCQGTGYGGPDGPIGPTTCGKCVPAVTVGQVCGQGNFSAGCPANASCFTNDTSAAMPTYTCVAPTYGDVGATCDDLTALCKEGLYCAAQTGQCAPFAKAGAPCGDGAKPPGDPGGCAPPLACVGDPGMASCSLGATGAFCLDDQDCAPGLGCIPGPCAPSGTLVRIGCAASGTCGPVTWSGAGQPCNPPTTLCLVGSCSDEVSLRPPPISPEGGLYPGTCGRVIADGQAADDGNVYATCDTFAEPFQANYQFMSGVPSPAGTCTLLDSVVCK